MVAVETAGHDGDEEDVTGDNFGQVGVDRAPDLGLDRQDHHVAPGDDLSIIGRQPDIVAGPEEFSPLGHRFRDQDTGRSNAPAEKSPDEGLRHVAAADEAEFVGKWHVISSSRIDVPYAAAP